MTTPFARMGGKSRIADQLISYFPDDYNLYVEPFLGSGNIFFRLPEDKKTNPMIINDLDKDIYIVMKALQKNPKRINDNIRRTGISKEEWHKLKDKKDATSVIEKIKYSFLAKGTSYAPSLSGSDRHNIAVDYTKFKPLLQNTIILNEDYKKVIAEYDGKGTFFYLDPPYEVSTSGYYTHSSVNPNEMSDILRKIKGRFILSFNDSPNIRDIFKDFYLYNIDTKYVTTHLPTKAGTKKKKELVISNFPLE
jgi:DNA adenine methylase